MLLRGKYHHESQVSSSTKVSGIILSTETHRQHLQLSGTFVSTIPRKTSIHFIRKYRFIHQKLQTYARQTGVHHYNAHILDVTSLCTNMYITEAVLVILRKHHNTPEDIIKLTRYCLNSSHVQGSILKREGHQRDHHIRPSSPTLFMARFERKQ